MRMFPSKRVRAIRPDCRFMLVTGALLTAGVLTAGLISFRQGNSQLGQKLMRARVVVQGATVALMVGTAYYYGETFKK
ncbi:Hypoxia induced protein, domain [Dillenia turbinata]|uniref:Hypoxia induced protein, domain n=1 Tax=Dillenia turbinata TaxID=194707 RepID=A0AAN8Z4W3_9MAGN